MTGAVESFWGALRETCQRWGWTLLAAHVRTNHVHAVLETDRPAEHVLNCLKAHASRALNLAGLARKGRAGTLNPRK